MIQPTDFFDLRNIGGTVAFVPLIALLLLLSIFRKQNKTESLLIAVLLFLVCTINYLGFLESMNVDNIYIDLAIALCSMAIFLCVIFFVNRFLVPYQNLSAEARQVWNQVTLINISIMFLGIPFEFIYGAVLMLNKEHFGLRYDRFINMANISVFLAALSFIVGILFLIRIEPSRLVSIIDVTRNETVRRGNGRIRLIVPLTGFLAVFIGSGLELLRNNWTLWVGSLILVFLIYSYLAITYRAVMR